MTTIQNLKGIILGLFIITAGFLFWDNVPVIAGASDNVSGHAWSENIGWVSFNCTDGSSCATSDYGVTVDASGNFSGYAWSDNVGWLSFNETSGCPSGNCSAVVSDGALSGWAKFIAGDQFSGGLDDGWDGWVSLSGTNYGVTIDGNGDFHGYAWGDDVVGWLSFNCLDTGACGASNYKVVTTKEEILPNENDTGAEMCSDGIDNDADGLIDCADTNDCSAYAICGGIETQCFDTIDNDVDGATDCADSDCTAICFPPSYSVSSSGDIFATFVGEEDSVLSSEITLTINQENGFSDSVLFSVSDWDGISGGTVNFSPQSLSSGQYESGSLFSVTIPNSVNAGTYTLTIQGDGGGLSRQVFVNLSVSVINPSFEEF